jgi:glutamate dehydrogenase/leucine dehydrogenase
LRHKQVEASGVRAQASAGSSGGPQVEELLEKQTKFVQRLQRTKAEIQTLKDNEAKLKAELDICRPAAETLQLERQRSNKLQVRLCSGSHARHCH